LTELGLGCDCAGLIRSLRRENDINAPTESKPYSELVTDWSPITYLYLLRKAKENCLKQKTKKKEVGFRCNTCLRMEV